MSFIADLLDFRLSPTMHIKITVFEGFWPKYNGMCSSIASFYCEILLSVAIIVVEIFASVHGTLPLLILYNST